MVVQEAPRGYYYGRVKDGGVIHTIPRGFETSVCGYWSYPLRRLPHPTERMCLCCKRELERRAGQVPLW